MKRYSIIAVLTLLASVLGIVAGAPSAFASKGDSRTDVTASPSTVYGNSVTLRATVYDESNSCDIAVFTAVVGYQGCDAPQGRIDFYSIVGNTLTGPQTFLKSANLYAGDPNLGGCSLLFCRQSMTNDDFAAYCCLEPGTYTIIGYYVPEGFPDDPDFEPSSDWEGPITVSTADASVSATKSPAGNTTYSQSVSFTVNVAGSTDPNAIKPTGSVSLVEGPVGNTTTYATQTLAGGNATLTTSALPGGTRSLRVHYSGDSRYNQADSQTITHTVDLASAQSTLSATPTSTLFGQPVTLTNTVSVVSPAVGTPTGTVTFNDGGVSGTPIGTATLNGGSPNTATLSPSSLAVGTHTLQAHYGGDQNFTSAPSNTVTVTVNRANTTTKVISSLNPSAFGQGVTFTASVAPVAPGTGTPDGTVQFKDGGANIGGPRPLSGGVATLSTSTLPGGSHSITAEYLGSSNYNSSTSSPPLIQTVSCANTITTNVPGDLNVSGSGTTCVTSGVTIGGSVRVPAGARVSFINASIGGAIFSSDGASSVTLCGTTVGSSVNIANTTGFVLIGDPFEDACAANTLRSSLTLTNNRGGVEVAGNKILGNTNVSGTTGTGPYAGDSGTELEANKFSGALSCNNNVPAPVNDSRPNTVAGVRSGQCAAPFS